jgi:hypothetical protein
MKTSLKLGDVIFSIRDMEMSNPGTVVGFDERRFVLVKFADGIPRPLPAESLQRPTDRKDTPLRPIGRGKIWEEATNLGDYLRTMGEADSGITKGKYEKSTR